MPTYCIICGKQRDGLPVQNDYVIDAIRWFKRTVTKDEQRNKLIVCKEDYPTYKKNINRYNSRQIIYLSLGVLFMLLGLAVSVRAGTFLGVLVVLFFLYLLSLLNYTPSLVIEKEKIAPKKHKHNQ